MFKASFKFISITVSALVLSATVSCSRKISDERAKEVIAYSYDSFAGEWGAAKDVAELFKLKTGYTLTVVNCDQAAAVLSRAVEEKDNVQADVIIGIDNNLAPKALAENILESYSTKNRDKIESRLFDELGGGDYLTPFDYSHFAMIFDTRSSLKEPQSLEDLTKEIYKGKIAIMDPRSSSVGLGFLSWTQSVYGDKTADYWSRLSPSILSLTPGWSAGWGMFKKGEVPLVISYTTSPASLVEYDNEDWAKALIFSQGHVEQVEGVGILKGAPNRKGAEAFIDFFTGSEAQALLPLTQWMNPANSTANLPSSYEKAAPVPSVTLPTDSAKTSELLDTVIEALGK